VPRYLVRLALERLASLFAVVVGCVGGVSVVAIGGGLSGRGGGLLFILLLLALAVGLLMRQRPFLPGALLLVESETGELLR
jgi:hypothetical protein